MDSEDFKAVDFKLRGEMMRASEREELLGKSVARMQARCERSFPAASSLQTAVVAIAKSEARMLRESVRHSTKRLSVLVENWTVLGEQLEMAAVMLECSAGARAVHGVDGSIVNLMFAAVDSLCDLNGSVWNDLTGSTLSTVTCVIDSASYVRESVSVERSTLEGRGCVSYVCGSEEASLLRNNIMVDLFDAEGETIECEDGDVKIDLDDSAIKDVRVYVCVNGRVELRYLVHEGHTGIVELRVSAFGVLLDGSECQLAIKADVMADSVILTAIQDNGDIATQFRHVLTSEWIPGWNVGECLYRGSVHGMTPLSFHERCDEKGPTLTLVRADEGGRVCVFGGFVSNSWNGWSGCLACDDAFLFSVTGPHLTIKRFPAIGSNYGEMCCDSTRGPCFGDSCDLHIQASRLESGSTGVFDRSSCCQLGLRPLFSDYDDPYGYGPASFTGGDTANPVHFTPLDIEVYHTRFGVSVEMCRAPYPLQ